MSPETQEQEAAQQSSQVVLVQTADPVVDLTLSGNAERDQLMMMRAKLDYAQRLARMFAMSGCFADIKDTREPVAIAKALVKIKLGESMGFSEAESMTGIDIIQGRVAVGASLRAARMQRAGFSWPSMICSDKGCWIPLEFQGKPMMQMKVNEDGEPVIEGGKPVLVQVIVSFTKKDAESAGLAGKDNYKKDPSSMYFARAITRAQRRYGPGVLGIDILDIEEARDLGPAQLREVATVNIDSFRPSVDENRGHDAAAKPSPEEKPAEDVLVAWADRAEMTKAFHAQKERVGEAAFAETLSEYSLMLGSAKYDSQKAMDCFRAMTALPAEKK